MLQRRKPRNRRNKKPQQAAATVRRKATADLGLAVKAVPVADALKTIEIKTDLAAVVREPLDQAKADIGTYMKEATAV